MTRIENGGENRQVTPLTARSKGKREMPPVRTNDYEAPLTNYRRQGGVGVYGPCSNDILRAALHRPLPDRTQR